MAERLTSILLGILPLFLVIPMLTGLFGGLFGQPQTRTVEKRDITNVSSQALQKTFSSARRFISHVFLKVQNPTNNSVTTTIKVGAFLNSETDTIDANQVIYATNVTIPPNGIVAFTVSSPVTNPQVPDPYINKYIKAEFGTPLNILVFSYSESEV